MTQSRFPTVDEPSISEVTITPVENPSLQELDQSTQKISSNQTFESTSRNSNEITETTERSVDPSSNLWLRRTDQIVVSTLLFALVVLLFIHWLRLSRWGKSPIEVIDEQPREYYYSLDINTASWVEWAQLDGIGETLAKRIVADREEHGPFRNPSDVGRVRGIRQKQLESMLPFLRGSAIVDEDDTSDGVQKEGALIP